MEPDCFVVVTAVIETAEPKEIDSTMVLTNTFD
jgi:hypothetical protein